MPSICVPGRFALLKACVSGCSMRRPSGYACIMRVRRPLASPALTPRGLGGGRRVPGASGAGREEQMVLGSGGVFTSRGGPLLRKAVSNKHFLLELYKICKSKNLL